MFYILKTNPHQKGEWGGTDYKNILIHSKEYLLPGDLRILANKYINIPFHNKYVPLFEEAKNYVNNIEVEEVEFNLSTCNNFLKMVEDKYEVSEHYFVEYIQDGHYAKTFPENFTFTKIEKGKVVNYIQDKIKRLEEKEHLKQQEEMKKQFKTLMNKLDKETILKMLLEKEEEK